MNKILNNESLTKRLNNNQVLIDQVTRIFLDKTPDLIETLKLSVSEEKSEIVEYQAHALKGMAANISAEKLASSAALLEIAGREKRHEDSKNIFIKLTDEYKELLDLLKSADSDPE